MALRQQNSGNQWPEANGALGAARAPMEEMHFIEQAGVLVLEAVSVGSPRAAEFVDRKGDRARYRLVLTGAPWVLIDSGGKLVPAASGTPAGILVDNGANKLRLSTDLTQTPAGAFYLDVSGRLVAVRYDSPKLAFVRIGTKVRMFETT
jgi:hypothetical protein